jgi:23S rRNA pseudouridine2605 synthase
VAAASGYRPNAMPTMRLQKFLSRAGIASRRRAEALIDEGRVRVNGETVDTRGVKVDPEADRVEVDGREVRLPERFTYLALHKPAGYSCTRSEEEGAPTVFRLLPDIPGLHHVGRLDKDSSGLLLLTNDGDMTVRLTHPRYGQEKEYVVVTGREVSAEEIGRLERGIDIGDEEETIVRARRVRRIGPGRISMVLTQGKYRQVRRMLAVLGHEVIGLTRVRIKGLELGDLPEGEWRELTPEEITALRG